MTKTAAKPFSLTVRREVDAQAVADCLVSAFEGGTGYWATIDNLKGPSYGASTCDEIVAGDAYLLVIDREGDNGKPKTHRLDRAAVARGLKRMAEDQPDHFRDLTSEDTSADATTGDVLLQLCLLGEVVYG